MPPQCKDARRQDTSKHRVASYSLRVEQKPYMPDAFTCRTTQEGDADFNWRSGLRILLSHTC